MFTKWIMKNYTDTDYFIVNDHGGMEMANISIFQVCCVASSPKMVDRRAKKFANALASLASGLPKECGRDIAGLSMFPEREWAYFSRPLGLFNRFDSTESR